MAFSPPESGQITAKLFENGPIEAALGAVYLLELAIPITEHFAKDEGLAEHHDSFKKQLDNYRENLPEPGLSRPLLIFSERRLRVRS